MSFVQRGRQRLGDAYTDFPGMFTNPDGTLTYDGQPYDPSDFANPYYYSAAAPGPNFAPTTIPLATSSNWIPNTDTTIKNIVTLTTPTPGAIMSSGLPAPTPSPVSGITGLVSSLSSLFGGARSPSYTPVPLSPTGAPLTVRPTTTSALGGLSTSTVLLLAAGLGLAVLASRRRA